MASTLGILEHSDLDVTYIDDDTLAGIYSELGALRRHDPKKFRMYSERLHESQRKRKGYLVFKMPQDTRNLTGKALFEKRMHLLPKEIRDKLNAGILTVSDKAIYSVKKATSDHIELFASADAAKKGIINLNRAMLPADSAMLLLSITLLSAKTDAGNDNPEKLSYDLIDSVITNGEFTMRAGQQVLFDSVSNEVFNRGGSSQNRKGEYILETPKLIEPQQEISFDLDLGATPEAITYVKVILRGIITVKA